jgi:hypothetical protein
LWQMNWQNNALVGRNIWEGSRMHRGARCYVMRTFPILFTFPTITFSLRSVIKTIANALTKSHSVQNKPNMFGS